MGKAAQYMILDAKVLLCSWHTEIHGLYFVPVALAIAAEVLVLVTSFVGKGNVMWS